MEYSWRVCRARERPWIWITSHSHRHKHSQRKGSTKIHQRKHISLRQRSPWTSLYCHRSRSPPISEMYPPWTGSQSCNHQSHCRRNGCKKLRLTSSPDSRAYQRITLCPPSLTIDSSLKLCQAQRNSLIPFAAHGTLTGTTTTITISSRTARRTSDRIWGHQLHPETPKTPATIEFQAWTMTQTRTRPYSQSITNKAT